jgi:hypothetical protein
VDGQWVIQLRGRLDDSLLVVYLELQDILRGVPTYLGGVREFLGCLKDQRNIQLNLCIILWLQGVWSSYLS